MLDIFKTYQTDEVKEIEGVWHVLGKSGDQVSRIKVARFANASAGKLFVQLTEERAEELKNAAADAKDAISKEISTEVAARTILVDWENLAFKGTEYPSHDVEAAKQMLAVPDFFQLVMNLSRARENFLVDEQEAVAKN